LGEKEKGTVMSKKAPLCVFLVSLFLSLSLSLSLLFFRSLLDSVEATYSPQNTSFLPPFDHSLTSGFE
jgi:hypothetical protein